MRMFRELRLVKTLNQEVEGSNPSRPTNNIKHLQVISASIATKATHFIHHLSTIQRRPPEGGLMIAYQMGFSSLHLRVGAFIGLSLSNITT
jgi:hypothetical protein